MKQGDRVKVSGEVLSVADGIATVEFNGTYRPNGQRIRIAVVAIDPEVVVDTDAAMQALASLPARMTVTSAEFARMRAETGERQ